MIELFEKFVPWKILSYFLANPTSKFHKKLLARNLNISPASVCSAVQYLEQEGILLKEEIGLAHIYQLNLANPLVFPLKKAYGLSFVFSTQPEKMFCDNDPNIVTLALFGSYASGEFDEKSDIDLLMINATQKEPNMKVIELIENKLKKEVNVVAFSLSEWQEMKEKNDAFFKNIVNNHILLFGSGLE